MVVRNSEVMPSLIKRAESTFWYGSCLNLHSQLAAETLNMSNDSVSSLFSTMDRASHPGWLFPATSACKRASFELHYSRQPTKKRLHLCCQSLPADTNDLGLQVCVCLLVFALETKEFYSANFPERLLMRAPLSPSQECDWWNKKDLGGYWVTGLSQTGG